MRTSFRRFLGDRSPCNLSIEPANLLRSDKDVPMLRVMTRRPFRVWVAMSLAVFVVVGGCGGGQEKRPEPVGPTATFAANIKAISVELSSFKFDPKSLEFNSGDNVAFQLLATDIYHDFTVPELGIKWGLDRGQQKVEFFTFTQPGTFELVCTVPGHEGAGMVGEIIVR